MNILERRLSELAESWEEGETKEYKDLIDYQARLYALQHGRKEDEGLWLKYYEDCKVIGK